MGGEAVPVAVDHLAEAARLLGIAFRNDPAMVVAFEGWDEDERQRHLTEYFAADLSLRLRRGWPLEVRDRGRTVAAATIYPPQAYPLPVVEQLGMALNVVWRS